MLFEVTFPAHAGRARFSRDGDWYVGEVAAVDDRGVMFKGSGRFRRSAALAMIDQVRAQLAARAPAGVDVGAWADQAGAAQQDLDRWVLEERLKEVVSDQAQRRGWGARPPWFEPWTAETVARAFRVIQGATAGDPIAIQQLDRIRAGALEGNPACVDALTKFDAVGRLVARGMSMEALAAALGIEAEIGAVPARRGRPVPTTRGRPVATRRAPGIQRPASGKPSRSPGSAGPTAAAAPISRARPSVTKRPTSFAAAQPMAAIGPRLASAAPFGVARPYVQPPVYTPAASPYPYGYSQPSYSQPSYSQPMGGGGGGDGGGGFPDDDGGDGGDGGLDFDDLSDPIPPPEESGSGPRDEDDDDEPDFPDVGADDGSGNPPPAPAPSEDGGSGIGPSSANGGTGAPLSDDDAGGDAPAAPVGAGVVMVDAEKFGPDDYPDEGKTGG